METTIMENQMEKKMENYMETREYIGVILGGFGVLAPSSLPCLSPGAVPEFNWGISPKKSEVPVGQVQ